MKKSLLILGLSFAVSSAAVAQEPPTPVIDPACAAVPELSSGDVQAIVGAMKGGLPSSLSSATGIYAPSFHDAWSAGLKLKSSTEEHAPPGSVACIYGTEGNPDVLRVDVPKAPLAGKKRK